jgi:hypothetical protein
LARADLDADAGARLFMSQIGHRPTGVRISGLMEYLGWVGSFRLDAGRPDHLAPLLGFFGDELAEVGG